MPTGLVALLDDVAALTKLAAASLDDVGAAAGRAGVKAAGVVIDDTAVTPGYVTGLTPDRELPIIRRIAVGSLRNKLLLLLPAALLLSWLAPWALTPLLTLGGAYLCFEGAEKILEPLGLPGHGHGHAGAPTAGAPDAASLERTTVASAVRTDLILSAEIMVIALATVADEPILTRAVVLAVVGVGITVAVYGVVAIIVKLDDIGLHLSRRRGAATRALGRGLVKAMAPVMTGLSVVGTAAMVWVGGGLLLHGAETFGWPAPARVLHHAAEAAAHAVPVVGGLVAWLIEAAGAFVVGLLVGAVIASIVTRWPRKAKAH